MSNYYLENIRNFDKDELTHSSESSEVDDDNGYGCVGLKNLGNTCYMNSVIQCLSNIPEFRKYLTSVEFIRDSIKNNKLDDEREIIFGLQKRLSFQLRKVLSCFWKSGNAIFKFRQPSGLRKVFCAKIDQFRNGYQHDSQEALMCMLDTMHEETCDKMILKHETSHVFKLFAEQDKKDCIDYNLIQKHPEEYDYYLSWQFFNTHYSKKYSEILRIFGGSVQSELICPITGKSSVKIDPQFFFTLAIPSAEQIAEAKKEEDETCEDTDDDQGYDPEEEEEEEDDDDSIIHQYGLESDDESELSEIELDQHADHTDQWGNYDIFMRQKIKKVSGHLIKPQDAFYNNDQIIWAKINRQKRARILERAKKIPDSEVSTNINYQFGNTLFKSRSHDDIPTVGYANDSPKNLINRHLAKMEKEKRNLSIYDCFDHFISSEKLDEDNQWYSPFAKKHVSAKKKIMIWDAPEILIVHFNRFEKINSEFLRHGNNFQADKIEDVIDFPFYDLDISKYVSERNRNKSYKYDLFAINNHISFGVKSKDSGHYYSFCKNSETGKWHIFNDTQVKEVDEKELELDNAYMLFYKRKE